MWISSNHANALRTLFINLRRTQGLASKASAEARYMRLLTAINGAPLAYQGPLNPGAEPYPYRGQDSALEAILQEFPRDGTDEDLTAAAKEASAIASQYFLERGDPGVVLMSRQALSNLLSFAFESGATWRSNT